MNNKIFPLSHTKQTLKRDELYRLKIDLNIFLEISIQISTILILFKIYYFVFFFLQYVLCVHCSILNDGFSNCFSFLLSRELYLFIRKKAKSQ